MIVTLLTPFLALAAAMVGVGLGLEEREHHVLVHSIIASTPAARNGAIHKEDRLLAVLPSEHDPLGWLPVQKLSIDEVLQLVRGAKGTTVGLRLEGPRGNKYQVHLPREEFDAP